MNRPRLTIDARCQIMLVGNAIEWEIEDRARELANFRSSTEITPEDVERATEDFLREEISQLPNLIAKVKDDYQRRLSSAA